MRSEPLWLRRFEDGSFRDKWSGLWFLDMKIADYFAVKTKNGWLSPEHAESVNFGQNRVVHTYTNGEEVVELRGNTILLEAGDVEFVELGLNIRHAYERDTRAVQIVGRRVLSKGLEVEFGGDVLAWWEDVHAPGGEQTRIVRVRIAPGPFLLRVRTRKRWREKDPQGTFLRGEDRLERLYTLGRRTLRLCFTGRGFHAGLPWFVQYWGRDLFWSVPALLREGYGSILRKVLLRFLLNARDGEIPRLIRENGTPEYGSIDTNPLFLLALDAYVRAERDISIVREYAEELREVFWFLEEVSEGGAVRSRGKDTWMDTLDNRKYPVEVQALWFAAAKAVERWGLEKNVSNMLKEAFWEKRHRFLEERSANVLVAGMYGLLPPREALSLAREWRLFTEWGVRTLSPLEIEYSSDGYHTGAVWGLTTGWGLYVAALAKDWGTFWKLVEALLRREAFAAKGCLDEVWDANTGKPLGADCQLWSGSLVLRAVDEALFDRGNIPPGVEGLRRMRWEGRELRLRVLERRNHAPIVTKH